MIPHGTTDGYRHHACRCADCRGAQAAAARAFRNCPHDPASLRHGELATYNNYLCRCLSCTAAKAADQEASRNGR